MSTPVKTSKTGRWGWLLLLLWVLCWDRGDAVNCPARCQCDFSHDPRTVRCASQGLTVFPENISDIVEYLDLSSNFLTKIADYIIRLDELQHLNLARNQLSFLPKNLHRLVNLRRLDLSHNQFQDATDDMASLEHLPQLKTLHLAGNLFVTLDGLRNPSVQFINADNCGINILLNTSLSGLPELTHLSLAGNPLKGNIINPHSPKLRGLDLSRCGLGEFTTWMIQGFPELNDLRLADNPELYYSTKYLTLSHQKLQKLDISRCNLDRPGLQGMPSLRYARFTSNSIRMLPDYIFAKNYELTQLFLDYNHLDHLNKSSFANLYKLQVLDLSANGLKTVPESAFKDNYELQFLNLSDNYLKEFPKLSSSVISLDLSANWISKLEANCLEGLPRIYILNLARNFISKLPNHLVSAKMRSLVLRVNRITTLNNVSMSGLPELEKFDLSENLLTQGIDPETFYDNPNLRQLHLQNNPWNCDCNQLHSCFIFLTSLETKSETLICSTPSNVNGYSWKSACMKHWQTKSYQHRFHSRAWGLVLVVLLVMIILSGMIISIRHSMKLKRQARNHRLEMERAEVRERLRLLQRRNMNLGEDHENGSEPRIHPLELISPPSYEEAVTMPRLARSLDGLDTVAGESVARMTASSESLRTKKLRRARRSRNRLRSLSEDNLARREMRREERLRRVRGEPEGGNDSVVVVVEEHVEQKEDDNNSINARKKSRRSSAKTGTSTDDEDSDAGKQEKSEKRIGKTVIRNLGREPRCGYRPSTDGES